MNQFLTNQFVENVQRLALGLEPIDSERRGRIAHPIKVTFNTAALGFPRRSVLRHDSCLYTLLYEPGTTDRVDLRFVDSARRFVPRFLRVPILTAAVAESRLYTHRVRRPMLFPGAAYDISATVTGLRGRVVRAVPNKEVIVRWARVEARLPHSGVLVGRAHGDDRGEFL